MAHVLSFLIRTLSYVEPIDQLLELSIDHQRKKLFLIFVGILLLSKLFFVVNLPPLQEGNGVSLVALAEVCLNNSGLYHLTDFEDLNPHFVYLLIFPCPRDPHHFS